MSFEFWSRPVRWFDFSTGKRFFLTLLLLTLAAINPSCCRPKHHYDNTKSFIPIGAGNKTDSNRPDTKFIKINQLKFISESPEFDHPTVTYKEDILDKNYVEPVSPEILLKSRYRLLPTEKIYFDILPAESLEEGEIFSEHDLYSIHLVPLNEDISLNGNKRKEQDVIWPSGNLPAVKDNNRKRRSAQDIWNSINPFLRYNSHSQIINDKPTYRKTALFGSNIYTKVPVAGKKHNALDIPVVKVTETPISFENRVAADENDRVIFSSRPTSRPAPTRRPQESIFRDPNPANFDFSFMNPGSRNSNANSQTNRQPSDAVGATIGPPSQVAMSKVLTQQSRPTTAPRRISECVWAIVNCCSTTNNEIRYNCFERNGCFGAFWDLNPCADNVRENIVNFVAG